MFEFTQRRATAGGGQDDGIDVTDAAGEAERVLSCELSRELDVPGMGLKRSTAALRLRNDHIETFAREYPPRGIVHATEEFRHHTALEERDAPSALAKGRGKCREAGSLYSGRHSRHETLEFCETLWCESQYQPIEPERLNERQ